MSEFNLTLEERAEVERFSAEIQAEMLKVFGNDIKAGISCPPKVNQVTVENIKKSIYDTIPKDQLRPGDCEAHTMWQNMSLHQRFLWWFFRKFLKDIGESVRSSVDAANNARRELSLETCTEYDYYEKIDYPRIFHPRPKTIIEVSIKVIENLNYVSVSWTVKI